MMINKYLKSKVFLFIVFSLVVLFLYFIIDEETLLTICQRRDSPSERLRCLIPYFKDMALHTSAINAIEAAKDLQSKGVIDDCHFAAHIIGAENLKKNNFDPGKAFSSCSMECIEGCHHGVMEEYVASKKTLELDIGELVHICDSLSNNLLLKRQCLHGVGHGILRHGDILLRDAIGTCMDFPDNFSKDTCLGGVFMQNVQNIILDDEKTFLEKIPSLCKPAKMSNYEGAESKCIEAIGEGAMFYTGHNLEKSKSICLKLEEKNQEQCIRSAEVELLVNQGEIKN